MAINNPIVTDSDWLQDTALAIQEKDGGGKIEVPNFAGRIRAIPSGGTLIPKTITENGVYNAADDNADGYDVVTVDVPDKNTLDKYFANTLEVANIPSARSIGANFFENKSNLVNAIMPNVTNIGVSAFRNCTNLVNAVMPNVKDISNSAFYRCANLALTSLPSGVTAIGQYAFNICTKILYLDFSEFVQIPTLGSHAFDGATFPFYFRDQQQIDEWAAATNWSTYADRFQIKPSEVI